MNADKVAQGQINGYLNQIDNTGGIAFLKDLTEIKQGIGANTDWTSKATQADGIGQQIYKNFKNTINTVEPKMIPINAASEDWLNTKSLVNGIFDNAKRGESFLASLGGRNKEVMKDALRTIDEIAGSSILQDGLSLSLANDIKAGKGMFGPLLGMLAGGAIGSAAGGLGVAAGGMLGHRIGRKIGKPINTFLGKAAMQSLIDNPIGQKVMSNALPAPLLNSVNTAFQNMMPSEPSQEQASYNKFQNGWRNVFPAASDAEVMKNYNMYKQTQNVQPQ